MDIKQLRHNIRKQRRALSAKQHEVCAARLRDHLTGLAVIQNANHIGLYLVNDGEIDPIELMHWAWAHKIKCYLPVLSQQADEPMLFALVTAKSKFTQNRFGIPEPLIDNKSLINASKLDVVLMPLVAFDLNGNRIGMGGGFYDRTLAFTRHQPYHQRPLLIGLAHAFQHVDKISPAKWDIPLDGIVTEQRATLFEQPG